MRYALFELLLMNSPNGPLSKPNGLLTAFAVAIAFSVCGVNLSGANRFGAKSVRKPYSTKTRLSSPQTFVTSAFVLAFNA